MVFDRARVGRVDFFPGTGCFWLDAWCRLPGRSRAESEHSGMSKCSLVPRSGRGLGTLLYMGLIIPGAYERRGLLIILHGGTLHIE